MTTTRAIPITDTISFGGEHPPLFIAGPCVIESREHVLAMARTLRALRDELKINLVFKSSFDKANRTSIESFRGPGLEKGLELLREVKGETGLPVLSDIHEWQQAAQAAEVLDVIQIPAFLCRQTDLIAAAARTGKPVAVKKGQFLSPEETKNILDKGREVGNDRIFITERGTSFGYQNLVVDMRSFPASAALSRMFLASSGERNCPFFTATGLPVRAAAAMRSVCRQRNAGI